MAKQFDEKLKILYILKILNEETDADHRLTTAQLIEKLADYGIRAERKSVYRDIDTLSDFGYCIDKSHSGCCLYKRTFELAELKLLVDAVQASKFISERKSRDIIKRLGTMASCHDAAKLNRGVYVSERLKSSEAAVLYTIDGLHSAINSNHKVSFKYLEWTPDKKKRPRHDGKTYILSPWMLIWDDENYYLLAHDSEIGKIKHFRVDKISKLCELEERREGQSDFAKCDPGAYSKKVFGMFNGDDDIVTLQFDDSMCGVIFDRFGTELTVFDNKDGTHSVSIPVKVSDIFLAWVVQFGGKVRITAPSSVIERMNTLLDRVRECHI